MRKCLWSLLLSLVSIITVCQVQVGAIGYSPARWMEYTMGDIGDKMLCEITLPGTHDSATWDLKKDDVAPGQPWYADVARDLSLDVIYNYSKCQELNIGQQLNTGIRYFDLRPCVYNGDIYSYHGLVGSKYSDIFNQVKSYMDSVKNGKELVILNLQGGESHDKFNSFSTSDHEKFISMITNTLGEYLYKGSDKPLLETKMNDILSSGSRIILIYQDKYYVSRSKVPGIWQLDDCPIYDQYSNQTNFDVMERDQLSKLKQNSGKKDKLFLLSWTLTPDAGTFADAMLNPFAKDSMREMCTEANPYLGDFVSTYAHLYKINVLYVDFCNLVDVTKFAMNANSQAIRVGNENDDSVLTSVSLATITHDDNKDHDTAIYAEIWTADGSTLIAKADGIENNTEYKDGPPSCHLVNIPLINKMTKRQCKEKAFTVKIKSKANGNDEWKFDTVVGLNFSDNVPMIANKDNIDLNSTRKHWWSSDSNFSDTATFGTVPKTPNPDLTIVNAAITSRTSNKITYTYTIKNTGTTTIPNLYNVVIQNYYSENTIFADAGDVPAGGSILGVSHSLAPGETYTGTFYSSVAVPSGMKYLTFKIDSSNSVAESDENNNTQALYIMYPDSSSSGVPDLTFTNASITSQTSSQVNYTYTIKNIGTATIPNLYNVSIQNFYSANTIFNDTGDIAAGGSILGVSRSLEPGETYTGTFHSLGAVPAGMKYLTFKIDFGDLVAESNENNNTEALAVTSSDPASSGLADLTFTNVSITSRTATMVNYTYTIKNIGTATIPSLYNVSIQNFYSANTIFNDAGDAAAGGRILGISRSLAPGESYTGTYTVSVPIPSGKPYITAQIDWGNIVSESNENNNTFSISIR